MPQIPMINTAAISFHNLKTDNWKVVFGLPALLFLVTLLPYANTFNNSGFFYDNQRAILEDSRVHSLTAENLRLILTGEYWWNSGGGSGVYRPVTTFSFLFNYAVLGNGTDATGYHVLNWLLHVCNALLVFPLAMTLFRQRVPAFFSAAVFSVHPLNVEAVTNLVGRSDLLATLALLACLHCYLQSKAVTGGRQMAWLSAMAGLWLLGLFAKESAIVLPGILFLCDLTCFPHRGRKKGDERFTASLRHFRPGGYLVLIPPLLIFWLVRKSIFAGLPPAWHDFLDNPLVAAGFWQARFTAIKVIGRYVSLLFWPKTLTVDYSYNQIPLVQWPFATWEDWQAVIALCAIAGMLWLGLCNYRNNRPLFFMILFFFGTLLPIANLLPRPGAPPWEAESWLIGTIMAERLMYLPSIGFAGFLVIAITSLSGRLLAGARNFPVLTRKNLQVLPVLVLSLLVAGLSLRTVLRNEDWRNEQVFWRKAAQSSPGSFRTHMLLASSLYHSDPDKTNIDTVIAEAEKALAITDRFEPLLISLGIYYRDKGDLLHQELAPARPAASPGKPWYEKSARILRQAALFDQQVVNAEHRAREIKRGMKPDEIADVGNTDTYYNLGLVLARLGQYDEALAAYRYQCHLFPFDRRAYREMATIFQDQQNIEQETLSLHQLVLLKDQDPSILNRVATIYRQSGLQECVKENDQGIPVLNYTCPAIHADICKANLALVETLVRAKQLDVAREIIQGSIRVFGCEQVSYNHLLPGNPRASVVPSR